MTPDLPAWTRFDPDAPPQLSPIGELPGRIVALVAGAGAMDSGWVGEVTLGLAASWGVSTGGRVVAADAAFQAPCLHRAASVPLHEGLSDMLLWGGSLQRVARAAERVGFVVTAGTPIADGSAALRSPRWMEVCEGCREAGVTLVVLVPASEAGLGAVVEEASDVVLLLRSDETAAEILTDGGDKVRATVGMGGTPPGNDPESLLDLPPAIPLDAASALAMEDPADAPQAFTEERRTGDLEAALREVVEETGSQEPMPTAEAPGDTWDPEDPLYRVSDKRSEEEAEGPRRARTAPKPSRGGGRFLALVALVVVLLVVVLLAAFLGYVNIPGITPTGAAGTTVGAAPPRAPARGTAHQAYSLDVGSFDDATAAAERATTLAAAAPDVVFFTQPVTEAGVLRYHVLAGPATDEDAASALRGRLATLLGAELGEARPVATPRAFQLGEMPELGAALRRVEVLAGLEIPAYVLVVDYEDGSVRYRVYAGAYAEESQGVGLARMLQDRGLNASALTERIGRLPGTDS